MSSTEKIFKKGKSYEQFCCNPKAHNHKVFCQLPKGHKGSHTVVIIWDDET